MKISFVISIILLLTGALFAESGFKYDAAGKRDPFVPLVSKDGAYISDAYGVKGVRDIRLEGILWDEVKGSVAIINGEIVKEGQKIGSLKVLKIDKDAVIFELDGKKARVKLINE